MSVKYYGLYLPLIIASFFFSLSSVMASNDDIAYNVIFKGISDKDLLSDIKSISDAYNIDHQVTSSYLLQKMAQSDTEKFLQLLKARSFYRASVKWEINTKDNALKLTFIIETGDPFILKSVKLEFADGPHEDAPKLPGINKLGFVLNSPFLSQTALDGQDELIRIIRSNGFPFVKIAKREVTIDHKDQSVSVIFYIDTGSKAFFGHTTISGLADIDESYVAGKVPWKQGDIFNGDLIEEARKKITELGLFTSVRITEGKDIDNESMISMAIEVTERKHRSIGIGLKYLTDEGPGAKLSWEHRNIFHNGEKLSTSLELAEYTTASETSFRKQDFLQNDQTLRFSMLVSSYYPEAYESKSIIGSAYIDRKLTKIFNAGSGITLKSSTIDQLGSADSYNLLSLPVYFTMDKSNDLLDPVIGDRLLLQLTPYYRISDESLLFNKALFSYKRYVRISRKPLIVVAAEVTASVIKGEVRDDIPADERLYAGGGGSVRGYEYQSVGPLTDGVPVGGTALFESSLEFRFKISERFGLVTFIDGGNAFKDRLFEQENPIRWGTGLGLRYYTPVGPFRLDVGFPLNRRKDINGKYIDDSYQIYISLGQAF